ncbi:MAG: hypothetical protein ACYCQL_04490 [Acidithiobacillus sp.]|jgi:hypothetical protein
MLQQWLMLGTNALQNESWHVVQFWAEMVEDAGRFARERFAMLDAATIQRRRNRFELVPGSAGRGGVPALPGGKRAERPRPILRRIV